MTEKRIQFPKGSVCINCAFLVSRVIKPHNLIDVLEDLGVNTEELDLDTAVEDGTVLDHFMCRALLLELDHDVYECDLWEKKEDNKGIIRNKRILKI